LKTRILDGILAIPEEPPLRELAFSLTTERLNRSIHISDASSGDDLLVIDSSAPDLGSDDLELICESLISLIERLSVDPTLLPVPTYCWLISAAALHARQTSLQLPEVDLEVLVPAPEDIISSFLTPDGQEESRECHETRLQARQSPSALSV
jgi:hypothetical protein